MKYRNEWKYQVTASDLILLEARLRPLIPPDAHNRQTGYAIRSLYFDDLSNRCLRENEAGVDDRRKFRIRLYNGDTSVIKLEVKEKRNGMTHKMSCPITVQQCQQILQGCPPSVGKEEQPPMNLLSVAMRTGGMMPKVIVEYERTAYVTRWGNVRITFDKNISASAYVGRFLQPTIPLTPIMPVGKHVLEVKFDEFLPDMVSQALELGRLHRTAFSKYYLSRLALPEPLAERAWEHEFQ